MFLQNESPLICIVPDATEDLVISLWALPLWLAFSFPEQPDGILFSPCWLCWGAARAGEPRGILRMPRQGPSHRMAWEQVLGRLIRAVGTIRACNTLCLSKGKKNPSPGLFYYVIQRKIRLQYSGKWWKTWEETFIFPCLNWSWLPLRSFCAATKGVF